MKFLKEEKIGEKGSIRWIILIIIGLIIASYFFDFSVQEAIEDEQTQSNFEYIKTHALNFYNAYLRQPINFFWNEIVIDIIWENLQNILNQIEAAE
ncbi:MAG: hypothetical protein MRY57_01185 [Candidatus Pacebacteria bacterium]|nr:hypothetical protein [Candidatus Paceibacterota bacterium]